jgi:hypothetical protein
LDSIPLQEVLVYSQTCIPCERGNDRSFSIALGDHHCASGAPHRAPHLWPVIMELLRKCSCRRSCDLPDCKIRDHSTFLYIKTSEKEWKQGNKQTALIYRNWFDTKEGLNVMQNNLTSQPGHVLPWDISNLTSSKFTLWTW